MRKYTIAICIVLLVISSTFVKSQTVGRMAANGPKHVLIMYDISKSMLDNRVANDNIKIWNRMLENILFGSFLNQADYPGVSISLLPGSPIAFPIIKNKDQVSFYTIGNSLSCQMQDEVYDGVQLKLTDLFPSSTGAFNQGYTAINAAELEYLNKVDQNYDDVTWVLLSDEELTINLQNSEKNDLFSLRNKYHMVRYLMADLQKKSGNMGSVKLSVFKIKFDQPDILAANLDLNQEKLTFRLNPDNTLKPFSDKILNFSAKRGYANDDISDIDVWLKIYDANLNLIKELRYHKESLPFILNSLDAKDIGLLYDDKNDSNYEFRFKMSVRYRYQGTPRKQDITVANNFGLISVSQNDDRHGWLKDHWYVIPGLLLAIASVFVIVIYLSKLRKEEFTLVRIGTSNKFSIKMKPGEEVKFGTQAMPTVSDIVFNISAPDYKLAYTEEKNFELICKGESLKVKSGDIFSVKDKVGNLIQLKLLKGKNTFNVSNNPNKLFNPHNR